MTLLRVDLADTGVTATLLEPAPEAGPGAGPGAGVEVETAHRPLTPSSPAPDAREIPPAQVWAAMLDSVAAVTDGRAAPGELVLTESGDSLALWDRDTLGCPRPAFTGADRRTGGVGVGPRLRWLAEHEPHTWDLVLQGRYAVGPLVSYLLARLTRGLWHLTDPGLAARTGLYDADTRAWSPSACAEQGVPLEALPELGQLHLVRTDPGALPGLPGLSVPVRLLARPLPT